MGIITTSLLIGIGVIIVWTLILLWMQWDKYILGIKYIEQKIWGKPLDKMFWKKGEWENTKLKIVWGKKNGKQKTKKKYN